MDALADDELEAWLGVPVYEAAGYAFRFAFRLTGQSADAEDLMQEGFLRLLARRARGQMPPVDSPISYLYKIIRNIQNDRGRRPLMSSLTEYDSELLRDPDDGPDDQAVLTLRRDSVARAIARLSHDNQEVIRLVIFKGMSRRETAQVLGIPEETVKSRLRAAKSQLRGILRSEEGS